MAAGITSPGQLPERLGAVPPSLDAVCRRFPMRVTPAMVTVMEHIADPIARQFIPHPDELLPDGGCPDPLAEAEQSPVPGLVHRYPDRVLLMATRHCAVYCRHCMRKRWVGQKAPDAGMALGPAITYIAQTPAIREVVISGGDPLTLGDHALATLLARLKAITHIRVLRIHTRVPGVLPERITPDLTRLLSLHAPMYVNIQFNHPREITPTVADACGRLADAGLPLGSQTVLLHGVNDNAEVLTDLMTRLMEIRVRPYYLHHPDPVSGTGHLRVDIDTGLQLMDALHGRCSGMAVPRYVIDLPGGHGKIPLTRGAVIEHTGNACVVLSPDGRRHRYPAGGSLTLPSAEKTDQAVL